MKIYQEVQSTHRSHTGTVCNLCKKEFAPNSYDAHGSAVIKIDDLVRDDDGLYGRTAELDFCRHCTHSRLVQLLQGLLAGFEWTTIK